jgi:hypothetical protein
MVKLLLAEKRVRVVGKRSEYYERQTEKLNRVQNCRKEYWHRYSALSVKMITLSAKMSIIASKRQRPDVSTEC